VAVSEAYHEIPVRIAIPDPNQRVDERQHAVRWVLLGTCQVPNPQPRWRGDRQYMREMLRIHRRIEVNLGDEALDEEQGPAMNARAIAEAVYRELYRNWPRRIREEEPRPGA
jgi:hypothetical protein